MKNQETTSRLENILNNIKSDSEVEEYIANHTRHVYESFDQYFNDYIAEHALILAEIIKRSNISKNYVYNIVNGNRRPGRDKIIALCIAAGMKCSEVNRALKIANEGILYPKKERDARIIIAVNRGIKSVMELNFILESEHLEIIE